MRAMTEEEHLGFTNYATAGVVMTVENDSEQREAIRDIVFAAIDGAPTDDSVREGIWTVEQAERFNLADALRDYVEREHEASNCSPITSQLAQAGLSEVDWEDIAEHFLDLAKTEWERMTMYERSYSNLSAASLTPEHHERTCGYWYTVTNGAMAHTAFATRTGLDNWLYERGLRLERDLPHGEYGSSRIIGTYRERSYLDDWADFERLRPIIATPFMNNGDYTLGLITEDAEGVRTVHYLNPNVKTRIVFDYGRVREMMS